jgi:hypothetical protein
MYADFRKQILGHRRQGRSHAPLLQALTCGATRDDPSLYFLGEAAVGGETGAVEFGAGSK